MPPSPTGALEDWLRTHAGYLHSDVRIAYNETAGLHWKATSVIPPNSTIISVPHSVSLSCLNALADPATPVFQQRRKEFKIETIGFFYLMTQWINREKSFWKPYLDNLPSPEDSSFAQPLWYDDSHDITWLEGTDVWHTALARREVYLQYYKNGIAVLQDSGVDTELYTWDLFRWAVTMFSSRSFTSKSMEPSEGQVWPCYISKSDGSREAVLIDITSFKDDSNFPILFPAMDATNHRHDAEVEWHFGESMFSTVTIQAIESGSEIYNNYGAKANDELLLGYGFCIENNPFDVVKLSLRPHSEDLQNEMFLVSPEYFESDGAWSTEKMTFRLPLLKDTDIDQPIDVFCQLPALLLEQSFYMLRHERRLPLVSIQDPHNYLTSHSSPGRQYLPIMARNLAMSLKLKEINIPRGKNPESYRQAQAEIYAKSQRKILSTWIERLRAFTRSLIRSSVDLPIAKENPPKSHLLRLETIYSLIFPSNDKTSMFLQGLAESTGTTDFEQLRRARWEEDVFVLLLCWRHLINDPDAAPLVYPDYVPQSIYEPESDTENDVVSEEEYLCETASLLMPVVQAAAAKYPDSMWADQRWTLRLLVRVGGAILQWDSMLVMCPPLPGSESTEEEPTLCVHVMM